VAAQVPDSVPAHAATGHTRGPYPCFDGLRAIAALMVVVYHSVFFATWFDTLGGAYLWNLNAGVWAFFVMSGFLLYFPFTSAHLGVRGVVDWRSYGLRRVARIYPAYWVVLAFFTFVSKRAEIVGVDGFLRNVTLTKTYVRENNPFLVGLPPAWSLVVELTFYAFLPFYAAAIGMLARRWRALSVELAGAAVLCVVGVVAIVAVGEGYDAPWITVLPQHLSAFALGMLLAVVAAHPWPARTSARLERFGRPAWAWWVLALGAFIAIPAVFDVEPFAVMSSSQTIGLNLCQTLLGFFLVVPAVLGPQEHGAIRWILRSRVLVFLGVVSYGIYLWHWFILEIVQIDWLGWPLREGNWVVVFALGLPVVVAAATASWYLVERPVLRWAHALSRDRLRAGRTGSVSQPAMRDV
jgi:peptidoglycan/LPS O-acetylase OafA/YrhL